MAKLVQGTKTAPVNGDTLIIKDSEDNNNLKEIDFSNIRVSATSLVSEVAGVRTYALWSDAVDGSLIGNYSVQNGADGGQNGFSIPDYDGLTAYNSLSTVYSDGFIIRSLQDNNTGNIPSFADGVFSNAFWETLISPTIKHGSLWEQARPYVAGDVVFHNNTLWEAWQPNTGVEPMAVWVGNIHNWHKYGTNSYTHKTIFSFHGNSYEDETHSLLQEGTTRNKYTRINLKWGNMTPRISFGSGSRGVDLPNGGLRYIRVNQRTASSTPGTDDYIYNAWEFTIMCGSQTIGWRQIKYSYLGGGNDNGIWTITWDRTNN